MFADIELFLHRMAL